MLQRAETRPIRCHSRISHARQAVFPISFEFQLEHIVRDSCPFRQAQAGRNCTKRTGKPLSLFDLMRSLIAFARATLSVAYTSKPGGNRLEPHPLSDKFIS